MLASTDAGLVCLVLPVLAETRLSVIQPDDAPATASGTGTGTGAGRYRQTEFILLHCTSPKRPEHK